MIADEVYGHLAFGSKPFVPMGVFGSIVPVLTLGSLSKRWIVPGWRLGWFVTTDPSGTFKDPKVSNRFNISFKTDYLESVRINHYLIELVHLDQIIERFKKYFDILGGPATFIQVYII